MIKLKSMPEPLEMMARSFAGLLPPSVRMGKDYWRCRNFMSDSRYWTEGQVRQYQLERLKTILMHAYENTKAYREAFDGAGVDPKQFSNIEDIRKYPFVNREDIRDRLEAFSADIPRYMIKSSGSTGIPLEFYYDRESRAREKALTDDHRSWIGDSIEDRHLVLIQRFRVENSRCHWKKSGFPRMLICSPNHMTPDMMEVFYREALKYEPKYIECYTSAGVQFAKFLKKTGRRLEGIRGVFCQSENVYNWQKELLKDVFGARVFAFYGLCELASSAGYCEHTDDYHVLPQYAFTELINREGRQVTRPGEVGEIVGTSFIMKATPFIRYRTRDFARLKGYGCSACGRPYQLWDRIEGRLQDMVVTKSGRYLNMLDMYDSVYDGVDIFQFYQDTPGRVVFRYIPKDGDISAGQRQRILEGFIQRAGRDVDIETMRVENISRTSRGKFRFLEQKLKLGLGDD